MQSKHLCGPVAGAVPQVGTSLTRAFQAPRGLLGLWEAGVEQDGVTDHGIVLDGALPQLKAFLISAGELFPGVGTAGSRLVLSDLSQCCSSLLAPRPTRNHTRTWSSLPAASSWRNCTNQRQSVSRSCQGGWASREATRKRCGKVLLEAEGKQTRQVLSPRCFPWPPRWKKLQSALKSGRVSERTQLHQL